VRYPDLRQFNGIDTKQVHKLPENRRNVNCPTLQSLTENENTYTVHHSIRTLVHISNISVKTLHTSFHIGL
jgi:hypothetical protein